MLLKLLYATGSSVTWLGLESDWIWSKPIFGKAHPFDDRKHISIGAYNDRLMAFLKFFRWVYNPGEPDTEKLFETDVKPLPRKDLTIQKTFGDNRIVMLFICLLICARHEKSNQ